MNIGPNDEVRPSKRINNRDYYSVPECARALGMSDHTLRREIYRRNIRHLRHARGIFILPEWADEWVERRTTAPRRRPEGRGGACSG